MTVAPQIFAKMPNALHVTYARTFAGALACSLACTVACTVACCTVACRNGGTSPAPAHVDAHRVVPAPAVETITATSLGERLWPGAEVGDYEPMNASEKRELAAAARQLWQCRAHGGPGGASIQEQTPHASASVPAAADMVPARFLVADSAGAADAVSLDGLVGKLPGARGRGVYLTRCDSKSPRILLQAPHPYYDQLTEQIALAWLIEASAQEAPRALFAGSVHRYWAADGTRTARDDSPADVSHNEAHEMTAATVAIAENQPGLIVVQVHGFGAEPTDFDMVLSSGTSTPSSKVVALAAAMRTHGYRVGVYPLDTSLLGATTNAQRRAIAPHGAAFVHIELARSVRQTLSSDASVRAEMWHLIAAAVTNN